MLQLPIARWSAVYSIQHKADHPVDSEEGSCVAARKRMAQPRGRYVPEGTAGPPRRARHASPAAANSGFTQGHTPGSLEALSGKTRHTAKREIRTENDGVDKVHSKTKSDKCSL